jgi:Mediator complex subunit 16
VEIENKLFLESVVPRSIRKAIYTVTGNLIGPQSPLDIPAVIFFDATWLGLSSIRPPGAQSLDVAPNATLWDTLRKQRLSAGKVRRCNRCGILSAIEDPPVVNELLRRVGLHSRNWTVLFMRNCLCFGTWSLSELE